MQGTRNRDIKQKQRMEEIAVIKVKFQESGGKNKEWKQEVNKEKEDK
jgi:hypothetical protein